MGMSPEQMKRIQQAQEEAAARSESLLASLSQDRYSNLKAEFKSLPLGPSLGPSGGLTKGADVFAESPSGAIMYTNGAIYNPADGRTYFPPDFATAAQIPGSRAWLREVQDKWIDEKVNEWRGKLSEQGYEVADKGGWGMDLITALEQYHNYRYSNYGKAVPLAGKTSDISQREAIRKGTDFQALKEEVGGWFDVIEMDPGEEGKEFFAERIRERMVALAKKHPEWSVDQIQSGAALRTQKEFVKAPGVKSTLREMEEDEMDETLRQSIVSVSQVGSI